LNNNSQISSKKIKTAIIISAILAVVIIAVGVISFISSKNYDKTPIGNTHSNCANRSIVTEADGVLYFADKKIYAIGSDNRLKTIAEYEAIDLVVHDGYIYYVNYDDNQSIYRTNLTTLDSEQVSSIPGGYINIVDDTLYYAALYGTSTSGVYKVDLNNFDPDNPEIITIDWATNLLYYNKRLYFINQADLSRLYSMKLDGSDRAVHAGNATTSFTFYEGNLYYSNVYGVYRCKPDGSSLTQLSSIRTTTINIANGYIYHCFYSDSTSTYDQSLYQMKMDGSKEIALTADSGSHLCYVGEYIYFRNVYKGMDIYRIKEDNSVYENFLKIYGLN
jgi:hypothetical protein